MVTDRQTDRPTNRGSYRTILFSIGWSKTGIISAYGENLGASQQQIDKVEGTEGRSWVSERKRHNPIYNRLQSIY